MSLSDVLVSALVIEFLLVQGLLQYMILSLLYLKNHIAISGKPLDRSFYS